MKHLLTLVLALGLFSSTAWAQRGRGGGPLSFSSAGIHEVQAGLTKGSLVSAKAGKDTVSVIEASGTYHRLIKPQVQAGGGIAFFSTSGGAKSQSYFDVYGMGTYNVEPDLSKSIYLRGAIGMFAIVNDKGEYESKLGFGVGAGKRFPIFERITYNPEARLMKKGEQDPGFELMFLNISLLF